MQVWTLHNPSRYAFVAADGPVILFDFHGARHLAEGLETLDEFRDAVCWFYFTNGPRVREMAKRGADEIAALVKRHGGGKWIETRLLSSRPRTNPWFNEAGVARQAPQLILVKMQ